MEKRKPMDVTIGTNMSKLRKQFNLTQREICSVVGVNTSTYKHYELGDRMVPISVLQDLAKFYKVSTNYFFENMPELSDKESLELSNYAFRVANNTQRYIVIDPKNPTKGLDEIEEKTQARAILRIKNLRLENNKSQKELAKYLDKLETDPNFVLNAGQANQCDGYIKELLLDAPSQQTAQATPKYNIGSRQSYV